MTNEEKNLARQFCEAEIGHGDFRSRLRPGVSDAGLPAILIGEALGDQDAVALELTIASLSRLQIRFPIESLESVLFETWHRNHEDIVKAIADLREPKAIPSLVKMVHWVPDYLIWDTENRALARNAVQGLGLVINYRSARDEIELIVESEWEALRKTALQFVNKESNELDANTDHDPKNSGALGKNTSERNNAAGCVTVEEKELAKQFCIGKITAEEFKSRFRPSVPIRNLPALLFEEILSNRDALALARINGSLARLRMLPPFESIEPLLFETWHHSHEDLLSMIAELMIPDSIPTLIKLAHWIPDYLMWDNENRAMSRKAVFGLGHFKDYPHARKELELIADSQWEPLRKTALRFLTQKK